MKRAARVLLVSCLIAVGSAAHAQTVTAVANGASFLPDQIAPGSIATIFGANLSPVTAQAAGPPWPTTLGGVTVRMNGGLAVPLYYVSPTQINFQAPSTILSGLPTHVVPGPNVIAGAGSGSNDFQFTASSTAPGVFVDSTGWAIAQNQDYSLNSAINPATVGSYVVVYLTGIGAVDNPVPDGTAAPPSPLSRALAPVTATIGAVNAPVAFAGLTPGYVGLAQVNIQVPNLPPGRHPLVVKAGGAVSNTASLAVSGGTVPSRYSLTALVGNGVSGNPASTLSSFAGGATVPYNYTPSSGFSAAVVEVDGKPAPASGSLLMDSNRWLWAFGRPAAGTDFNGFITAPNDPTIIPYPQFYANRPTSQTVRVSDPYCSETSRVVAYPSSYLGSFPMPEVKGAPLPNSVQRGVDVLDVWGCCLNNPAMNSGCSGSMRTALQETVARVKRLGADHIVVTTYPFVVDASAATPVLDVAGQQTSASDLAFIVNTASAAGLDVWLYINIPGTDNKGADLPAKPSQQWFSGFLRAYVEYIGQEAQVAQKAGVKAIMLNWRDYSLNLTDYLDAYAASMTTALAQVRGVFNGKVIFYDTLPWEADPNKVAPLIKGVDAILIVTYNSFQGLSQQESQHLTVDLVKQRYKRILAWIAQKYSPFGKPPFVVESYAYSNMAKLMKTVPGDEMWGCRWCTTTPADFSVQAIAYEALLEATAESGLPLLSFETYGYWYTDVMLPGSVYPSVGRSIRNKPAESIIYRWFQRRGPE